MSTVVPVNIHLQSHVHQKSCISPRFKPVVDGVAMTKRTAEAKICLEEVEVKLLPQVSRAFLGAGREESRHPRTIHRAHLDEYSQHQHNGNKVNLEGVSKGKAFVSSISAGLALPCCFFPVLFNVP